MILTIRTDKPEAEIGVFSSKGEKLQYLTWQAHRQLEATILEKIDYILNQANSQLEDLSGLVVYAGPGSFTGLRIGFAVTNTLAEGLGLPNVKSSGETWVQLGVSELGQTKTPSTLVPDYGGEANITKPKK